MEKNKWKIIDSEWLKYIAIIAMTMDHFALIFFASGSTEWTIFRVDVVFLCAVVHLICSAEVLYGHGVYAVRGIFAHT